MRKIGVVLSGCGYLDGAEIHEAVITLLSLDKLGVDTVIMAPNVRQMHVIDHVAGKEMTGETRNVLVESARIARGKIRDIATVQAGELDALMFPGGYGAAKNLCDFAVKGELATVHPEVARLVRDMYAARKWICAVCISPVVIAKVLEQAGVQNPELTIGIDPGTADKMRSMGVTHVECPVDEFRIDATHRLISSPAYMYDARISEVARGIERAAETLIEAIEGRVTT